MTQLFSLDEWPTPGQVLFMEKARGTMPCLRNPQQDLKTAILISHKGKPPYLFRSGFTLIMTDAKTSREGRAPWSG